MTEKSKYDTFARGSNDFGFALTSDDDPVRYDSATLYVEIWSSKGEVDLIFGVKVDTDIIRPYVSHVFSLAEVVRYYLNFAPGCPILGPPHVLGAGIGRWRCPLGPSRKNFFARAGAEGRAITRPSADGPGSPGSP